MEIEIIEDCSPYFIRFKHAGSDDIIERCRQYKLDQITNNSKKFLHYKLPVDQGKEILTMVPGSNQFDYLEGRVSLFVTQPGVYYRPHRDGLGLKMGINYIVDVKDDKCVTSWYSFEEFEGRPIDNLENNNSREIADFNWRAEYYKHKPLKSFTAKQGEVVLFNTDLYHDVNNVYSKNERTILTIRSGLWKQPTFEEARKGIFGF